jgi:hypothetical protein
MRKWQQQPSYEEQAEEAERKESEARAAAIREEKLRAAAERRAAREAAAVSAAAAEGDAADDVAENEPGSGSARTASQRGTARGAAAQEAAEAEGSEDEAVEIVGEAGVEEVLKVCGGCNSGRWGRQACQPHPPRQGPRRAPFVRQPLTPVPSPAALTAGDAPQKRRAAAVARGDFLDLTVELDLSGAANQKEVARVRRPPLPTGPEIPAAGS